MRAHAAAVSLAGTSCALVAVVAAVGTSIAAGSSQPITAKVLAVAGEKQPFSFTIPGGSKSVIETIRVAPGGSFGWHSHGAPVAAIVTSGALTLYDTSHPGCGARKMSAGQGFYPRGETGRLLGSVTV